MTPEQDRRGAELFAAGASERQVATELGIGTGTAHRLRERLAQNAASAAPSTAEPGGQNHTGVIPSAPGPEAAETRTERWLLTEPDDGLGGLQADREQLLGVVATYEGRAAASRSAIGQLEAERLAALAAGDDAAALRPRMRDAADDLADSEEAARIARERLTAVDERIAGVNARRDLQAMRGQLAAAVAERDQVCARTGDRQRAAVRAVCDAAADFTAAATEEDAATRRVAELTAAVAGRAAELGEPSPDVPPAKTTALWVHPDLATPGSPAIALSRAITAARRGDVRGVAGELALAFGWLPLTVEEEAAERDRVAAFHAQMTAQQPAPVPSQPWTRADTSSVALDAAGREIPAWMIRPPHPLDVYHAPALGGPQQDPGYRFE